MICCSQLLQRAPEDPREQRRWSQSSLWIVVELPCSITNMLVVSLLRRLYYSRCPASEEKKCTDNRYTCAENDDFYIVEPPMCGYGLDADERNISSSCLDDSTISSISLSTLQSQDERSEKSAYSDSESTDADEQSFGCCPHRAVLGVCFYPMIPPLSIHVNALTISPFLCLRLRWIFCGRPDFQDYTGKNWSIVYNLE